MTEKKLPQRRCVGCMKSYDKNTLLRIVKLKDGSLKVDVTGKLDGRGAYICKNKDCFNTAKKRRRLEYAFKGKIPDEVYSELESEFS